MKFARLSGFFDKIEAVTSRLTITQILSSLFKELNLAEMDKTMYLLQGRVAPLFSGTEFGMAEKMVSRSAILALSLKKEEFNAIFKKIGDIGETVEYFKKQRTSFLERELSILEVFARLYKLAKASGQGSQDEKIRLLADLISQTDPLSARYISRIPQGMLRLGFSDMTVLDAFSWMIKGDKSLRSIIEKAYHVRPDLGFIGKIIKEKGIGALKDIQPEVFTPIIMMRAERLSSGDEIMEKIGTCAVEPKYDGFRLQAHYRKNQSDNAKVKNSEAEIKLFSRNLEDVSYMYPDIVAAIKKEVKADEIIFEGEAIGFDPLSGSFLPFQETVQRKRKYNIAEKSKEIPLKFFTFELLFLNGKKYLDVGFEERRKKLEEAIKVSGDIFKDTIMLASSDVISDGKKLEIMFDDAVTKGLEGVLAKKLKGIYQPGARGWNWIKFKRSYSAKINDTLDCLVMGYDFGRGKRTEFGMGAFLVGIYDRKNDKFQTVAKIGTGLLDNEWKELKKRCKRYEVDKQPSLYDVDKLMNVDVWVTPSIVVEIRADEITRSPVHTAGRVLKPSKSGSAWEVDVAGFALRFPRLERFRDDKRIEDVTSLPEIETIYKQKDSSK